MLDLAAKVWQLPLPETVRKLLSGNNGPANIDVELAAEENYRKYLGNIQQLIEEGSEYLARSESLYVLADKLDLNQQIQHNNWAAGPGQVLLGAHNRQVELCLAPTSALMGGRATIKGRHINNPSAARMFRGLGWRDVFLIPLYSLPGRLRSLILVGRNADPTEDILFRALAMSRCRDAGLAIHPDFYTGVDGTLMCVQNPLVYLWLHVHHFSRHHSPLPVALWYADKKYATEAAWDSVPTDSRVFVLPQVTGGAVAQAIATDSKVFAPSMGSAPSSNHLAYWQRYTPEDHLALAAKRGLHWPDFINRFVESASDAHSESLIVELDAVGIDIDLLNDACSKRTKDKIRRTLRRGTKRTASIGPGLFVEDRPDGWYWQGKHNSSRLCDTKFYIDNIVHFEKSGKSYYQGRIQYDNREIPFCSSRRDIETNTASWLRSCMISAGEGLPKESTKGHSKTLLLAALQFSNPIVVSGIDTIGWNNKTSAFELPRLTITAAGKIRRQKSIVLPQNMPAWNISVPDDVAFAAFVDELLVETAGNVAFMAAWLLLAHNIVAPVYGLNTSGIAVAGQNAVAASRAAAAAIGTLFHPLSADKVAKLQTLEKQHNWPAAIGLDLPLSTVTPAWLSPSGARNCITAMSDLQALGCHFNGGWTSFVDNDMVVVDSEYATSASGLLPLYLADLASRNFVLVSSQNTLFDRLVQDVSSWFESLGKDPTVVAAAGRLVDSETVCKIDVLGKLLARLVCSGCVEICRPKYARQSFAITSDGIFLPRRVLLNSMAEHLGVSLNGLAIARTLADAGCLVSDGTVGNAAGWTVPQNWFQKHMDQVRRQDAVKLRVTS